MPSDGTTVTFAPKHRASRQRRRLQAARDVHEFMAEQQRHVAETIDRDDAELRAGPIGALILGTILGRHLLGMDGLRDADPERIAALLRPCFRALTGD